MPYWWGREAFSSNFHGEDPGDESFLPAHVCRIMILGPLPFIDLNRSFFPRDCQLYKYHHLRRCRPMPKSELQNCIIYILHNYWFQFDFKFALVVSFLKSFIKVLYSLSKRHKYSINMSKYIVFNINWLCRVLHINLHYICVEAFIDVSLFYHFTL